MMKYRKLSIVIEAWPVSELLNTFYGSHEHLPMPIAAARGCGDLIFDDKNNQIQVKTLEGWMFANWADMIICGVEGELYPCKPGIFTATYEVIGPGEDF